MPRKRNDKNPDQAKSPDVGHTPPVESEAFRGRPFPIVGIGASAGGLEALKAFFAKVPEQSGMAYVVVVHMAPRQPSMLSELLQRVTSIPVKVATDGESIAPNHLYVVPPDKDLIVYKGSIQLLETMVKGTTLPIDFFLRSLAQDQQANAVGVILSGTGTDGSLGLKEINACEGLVMVQSEETANYNGMPKSAINTGIVDLVLPPAEMPEKLMQYFKHFGSVKKHKITPALEDSKTWLGKVLALLHTLVGHDFSVYKQNTIVRRIKRRMGVNQISNPETYIRFMREYPQEAQALFRELLIGVTSFFRDATTFDILKKDILPEMLAQMEEDGTFRVWAPGCSSGEEVYSLAMIMRECLDDSAKRITLQLFGTDIDKYAIDKAREGIFPESIAADVSPARLNRFFLKEGHYYRIRKELRDIIVFSVQDVLKDPPFSRLNLLCCRNLLIYLDSKAQKKLLPLFHYTLTPRGILVLGPSETIGEFTHLFASLNNKWKIYQRREVPQALLQPVVFPTGGSVSKNDATVPLEKVGQKKFDLGPVTQKVLLEQFAPPAVLVDAQGTILHIVGRTGKYLEPATGSPTNNILDMARAGLRLDLSSALRAAATAEEQVTRKMVQVRTNGDVQPVDLHVWPLKTPRELAGLFLVVFEDLVVPPSSPEPLEAGQALQANQPESRITELEKELQSTRESHQTTIEELESSNEELKSTCEELQSANEELQSTNEEMESSREELQSVNEELHTVNSELQAKLEELATVYDDMRNLLNGTKIATIFVDNHLRVKRFTQEAANIINLIGTDLGRPLQHVVSNLIYENMIRDLASVLENLTTQEREVQSKDGKWYSMRIMPYRTTDNRIDGAVLTFTSIDEQKKTQTKLETINIENEQARMLIRNVFDMNPQPLAVTDPDGIMVIANQTFSKLMNIVPDQIKGRNIFSLEDGGLDQTALRTALQQDEDFHQVAVEIDRPAGKKRWVVHGRKIGPPSDRAVLILLQFEDDQAEE